MKVRKRTNFFLPFLLVIAIHFASCKDEDSTAPVVNIASPLAGQQFAVGDTVHVVASVSDDHQVSSVTVRLLNSNYNTSGHDELTTGSGKQVSINTHYIIDKEDLETGEYLIAVIASDGRQETNAYASIHISEIPKIRKGIFLLSAPSNTGFDISKLDSMNQPIPVIHVPGDYASSAIYSTSHELFTIGSITGAFNIFDLNTNSTLWSHPSVSFPLPTFRNLFFEDDRIYVSYYDGSIRGYDKTGTQKYEIVQQGFFIPDVVFKNDQYLFSEIYYPASHQNKIGVFYLVTGAPRQESPVDMVVRNMCTLDANRLLLFGNDTVAEQGKIELYDINGNGNTFVHAIPSGVLYQTIQLDHYKYLIAHSDGIYLYDYSLNSLTPFITGLPVYSLAYDDLNKEIFACSGNHVVVYNSITATPEYTITNADSILAMHLLYNK